MTAASDDFDAAEEPSFLDRLAATAQTLLYWATQEPLNAAGRRVRDGEARQAAKMLAALSREALNGSGLGPEAIDRAWPLISLKLAPLMGDQGPTDSVMAEIARKLAEAGVPQSSIVPSAEPPVPAGANWVWVHGWPVISPYHAALAVSTN